MNTQDWEPVVLRNPSKAAKPVVKRNEEGQRLAKLNEMDDVKVVKKRIQRDCLHAMQAARTTMKKTQKEVEKELAFPVNLYRDIEAGTVLPNGKQISALHRYFAASGLSLKVETY